MQNINSQQAFYKRLTYLITSYSELFNTTRSDTSNDPEDLNSYFAGIITGLREVECYLTNHEPWSREMLILDLVIQRSKILYMRRKNQNVMGFNLIFSEGEEKAMDILQNEVYFFFPYFTRNIVVCKNA